MGLSGDYILCFSVASSSCRSNDFRFSLTDITLLLFKILHYPSRMLNRYLRLKNKHMILSLPIFILLLMCHAQISRFFLSTSKEFYEIYKIQYLILNINHFGFHQKLSLFHAKLSKSQINCNCSAEETTKHTMEVGSLYKL